MPAPPPRPRILAYLAAHWHGSLPLSVSFWLNFLGIGLVAHFLQQGLVQSFEGDVEAMFFATLASFVVLRLVIFPWQAIGVLRASEHALQEMPTPVWARGAQAAVIVGVLIVLIDGLGVFHAFYAIRAEQERIANTPPPPVPGYRLSVSDDGGTLYLTGGFDPGVTRATRQILKQFRSVTVVVLESNGGRIYEGRGLAKLIQERGLDTHVEHECSSACTTAFVGGETRTVAPLARLGFHGYRLEAWNVRPDMDPLSEQRTDMAFYASRGVDVARLARAMEVAAGDMWYPGNDALLAAGIAHRVTGFETVPP